MRSVVAPLPLRLLVVMLVAAETRRVSAQGRLSELRR